MSGDEEILYGYIQEAAREGIWTKTLKAKTNMHTTTMNKALKGLEGKRFVKAIKSVKVSLCCFQRSVRVSPPVLLLLLLAILAVSAVENSYY